MTAAIVQVKGRVSESMIYIHLEMEIFICYGSCVETSLISINFAFLKRKIKVTEMSRSLAESHRKYLVK